MRRRSLCAAACGLRQASVPAAHIGRLLARLSLDSEIEILLRRKLVLFDT